MASLLRKVQWGDFAAPRKLNRTIDPALEAVCLKAMTFAAEERYATSRALADDIERWTAGQPVSAWQEPLSRRARRWVRRSQTAVAALVGRGSRSRSPARPTSAPYSGEPKPT